MFKSQKLIFILVVLGVLSGCGTTMPLNSSTTSLDTSQKSIIVGRISIKNKNVKGHQPQLIGVTTEKNGKKSTFTKPYLVSEVKREGKDYVFSLAAEPGEAKLKVMNFMRTAFLINANASLPFEQEIVFHESGIAYIGNIDASIVKRKSGQPRAGAVLPLIDQSVAGFSGGTFVVDIKDNYDEDISLIKQRFPFLEGETISKSIMSDWVHPRAKNKDDESEQDN